MEFLLPSEAEKMISARCTSKDSFDSENFDPIEHLNSRFTPDTRSSILAQYLHRTKKMLEETEQDFLSAVEHQSQNRRHSQEGNASRSDFHGNDLLKNCSPLDSTPDAVRSLCMQVASIEQQAERSEEIVNAISDHMRKLDVAKSNITSSIYTLRCIQLWMLQLQAASTAFGEGKYLQCHDALKEAQSYEKQLSHLADLPLFKEIEDAQQNLCKQLDSHTYYIIFPPKDPHSPFDNADEKVLGDVCGIIDLLGKTSRERIREHFIEFLLRPYALRFKKGTEDAKIERTERRFIFLRTILDRYGSLLQNIFPPQWCVPQELCLTFCLRTKEELDYQLKEAAGKLEVAVLTFVLQKTIDFEKDLTLMMEWKSDFPGKELLPNYKYNGLLLSAFKEHMGIIVKNEYKQINDIMAQPLIGEGPNVIPGWNSEIAAEEVRPGTTLPLADDLFVFIKESFKRTLRISQQDVLAEMAIVWRKSLLRLAQKAGALLPPSPSSPKDLRRACILANTAVLCRSTVQNLADEVQHRSGLPSKELQFQLVVDAFSNLYSNSVQSIVKSLLQALTPLFQSYVRHLSKEYVEKSEDELLANLKTAFRSIVSALHDCFLTCSGIMAVEALCFFLDKSASSVISAFSRVVYECSRINSMAAKHCRDDSLVFKKVFLELPYYNDPKRFSSTSLLVYQKVVHQQFATLLAVLKVLEVSTTNMQEFTDCYFDSIPPDDRSIAHFVMLVELKGVHRAQVRKWITDLSKRGVVQDHHNDSTIPPSKQSKAAVEAS